MRLGIRRMSGAECEQKAHGYSKREAAKGDDRWFIQLAGHPFSIMTCRR
jgi:hypothetical protein